MLLSLGGNVLTLAEVWARGLGPERKGATHHSDEGTKFRLLKLREARFSSVALFVARCVEKKAGRVWAKPLKPQVLTPKPVSVH